MNKKPEISNQLEHFDLEIVNIDPWNDHHSEPRKLHTCYKGFNFESWLWEYSTLCKVLNEVGFIRIEQIPYTIDPDYSGKYDLERFNLITDGYIIKAVKEQRKQ